RHSHQTMTVSVAAGARGGDSLPFGGAPAARVLLVRSSSTDYRLPDYFEGYLDAARRPRVDILTDTPRPPIVPGTSRDFARLFCSRLIAVYRKPIFHSAGNYPRLLNGASSLGDVFSVGGAIGPSTLTALYADAALEGPMPHPLSAAGPSLDGALKPDFLAPANRLAADTFASGVRLSVPRSAPAAALGRGYQISCCTPAGSPYAAGIAALLISAAKQERVPYSVETLGRALRAAATFLDTVPAYQQGSGLLDVNAAWRELQRRIDVPRIRARAANV